MSLSSITAGGAATSGAGDTALSQLSQDYTKFMKLLVAQIQNQDPMEPVDSTQFISQVAQLTQVEQSVQTNKHMEALRSTLSINGALFETALIGRSVTVPSETFTVGEFGGSFSYELEKDADVVEAVIKDASGQVVQTIRNLSAKGGTIVDVIWDGNTAAGVPAGPGTYTVEMASSGGVGGGYNTYSSSTVTAVEYLSDKQMLRLQNGRLIDSGSIIRAS